MIDIHSHIIPGVDDGSSSIEETMNLLKEAEESGVKKIVFTPHYYKGMYEVNAEVNSKIFEKIKECIELKNINVEVYLGNEIYFFYDILNLIKENEVKTINSKKYILIELPMERKPDNLSNVILDIISKRYIPIIAHPERYAYVQKDPNMLIEYIEKGVLFQSNIASFGGYYGSKALKTVRKLVKNNMVHFLASDVHFENSIYKNLYKIKREILDYISLEKFNQLTEENPQKVLDNVKIEIDNPIKIKTFFLN